MGKIAIKRIQPMIDVHLDYVEAELGKRPIPGCDQAIGDAGVGAGAGSSAAGALRACLLK